MGVRSLEKLGLAAYGVDVTVCDKAQLLGVERMAFGNHVIVDDFVLLQGGQGLTIGDYVHIASFVSVTGGGTCKIGHFAGIASGSRLMTGTDLADGSGLMGPQMPAEVRSVVRPGLTVGAFAFVGANTVVQPGVEIGEGAVVGASSLVLGNLEPWSVNVGVPARPIKERPRDAMLALARQLGYDATG
jgi:acetyltransferase-like isoleucine patch superfamily enzyme